MSTVIENFFIKKIILTTQGKNKIRIQMLRQVPRQIKSEHVWKVCILDSRNQYFLKVPIHNSNVQMRLKTILISKTFLLSIIPIFPNLPHHENHIRQLLGIQLTILLRYSDLTGLGGACKVLFSTNFPIDSYDQVSLRYTEVRYTFSQHN